MLLFVFLLPNKIELNTLLLNRNYELYYKDSKKPKNITFPSNDNAIACFPPECTATVLITNWLRPGI